MNQIVSGGIVAAVVSLLAVGAVSYGNGAAMDGLAALGRKYVGKCVGLADGRTGTIEAINAKTIRVMTRDRSGTVRTVSVRRVPDLDVFMVRCPG